MSRCAPSRALKADLFRSRVFSLFPSETGTDSAEALSPVLGHLIDISLALVLLERPVIVSPYSVRPLPIDVSLSTNAAPGRPSPRLLRDCKTPNSTASTSISYSVEHGTFETDG